MDFLEAGQASDHVGRKYGTFIVTEQVEPEAEPQQIGTWRTDWLSNSFLPISFKCISWTSYESVSLEQSSFWQLEFQSFCETIDTSPRFVCRVCAAVTSKEVKIECTIETKILDPLKSTPSGSPKLYYPVETPMRGAQFSCVIGAI